jgi:hypothetical protein
VADAGPRDAAERHAQIENRSLYFPRHTAVLAASSGARSPAAPPTVSAAGSNLLGLSAAGVSRQPECLVGSGNGAVHVVGSTDGDTGDDVSEASRVVGVPNVAIGDHLPADEMADVRVSVVKAWSLRSRFPPAAAAERGPHAGEPDVAPAPDGAGMRFLVERDPRRTPPVVHGCDRTLSRHHVTTETCPSITCHNCLRARLPAVGGLAVAAVGERAADSSSYSSMTITSASLGCAGQARVVPAAVLRQLTDPTSEWEAAASAFWQRPLGTQTGM